MTHQQDIALLSANELVRRYRDGSLSPVEATSAALGQIERHNAQLNAFCMVDSERAMRQALESEQRYRDGQPMGPVDGVPTGVKDIFLCNGTPTLRGSVLTDPDQAWEIDAPTVAALRRNGAVLMGKTTTPELGWKGVTDSPLHGVTRNPWNPALTPGGSSGGTATAIASGMVPIALGTDGGGSIRIPASFTGISGIKPTYGRVPHWPISPYGTLAHAGPMARSVEDVALMLQVIVEPDSRDWLALPIEPDIRYLERIGDLRTPLRVAYSPDLGFADVDPEVAAIVERAVRVFESLGAAVDNVELGLEDPIDMFEILWNSGAAHATRTYSDEQRSRMDPGLQEIVAEGRGFTAVDYVDASTRRGALAVWMNTFHETYDLLLTPTMPIPAFEAGQEVPTGWPHRRWTSWSPFSYPFNLTQQPAASVPCGFTEAGLPVGLHIVGRKYEDPLVLAAAHAYQQACPEHLQWPALVTNANE